MSKQNLFGQWDTLQQFFCVVLGLVKISSQYPLCFFFACKSRYVTVDPCARVNSVYLPTYLITRLQLACRSALVSDLRRPHFQLLENKTQKKASHATSDKLPFTFPTLKTEIEGLWTSTEARRRIVEF